MEVSLRGYNNNWELEAAWNPKLKSKPNWSKKPPENYAGIQKRERCLSVYWNLRTKILFVVKEVCQERSALEGVHNRERGLVQLELILSCDIKGLDSILLLRFLVPLLFHFMIGCKNTLRLIRKHPRRECYLSKVVLFYRSIPFFVESE